MATQTFQHSSFGGGIVRIEFDVNDANWRMSRVRCVNNSAFAAAARILNGGAEVFTASAPAGQTTSWNTTGVQLGWDTVDGGLIMGNYVMQARWPLAIYVGDAAGNIDSEVVAGLGLPWNRHVSYSILFQERGAVTPPVDPGDPGTLPGEVVPLLQEQVAVLRKIAGHLGVSL